MRNTTTVTQGAKRYVRQRGKAFNPLVFAFIFAPLREISVKKVHLENIHPRA